MVAFGMVGRIFDAIGIYDSDIMSDVHWLIRVSVFAGLTWLGVKIAQFIKWLFGFQWWVYVIAGVVFIGIIILVYYIKHRISKNKAQQVIPVEEPNAETTVQTEGKEEPKVVITESKNIALVVTRDWSNGTAPTVIFTGASRLAKPGVDTLVNSYKRKGITNHGKEKS